MHRRGMEILARGQIASTGELFTVVVTERSDGDFAVDRPSEELERIRREVVDLPWVWMQQVHGADVAEAIDEADAGQRADAVLTGVHGLALAVHTADCAPVALVDEGSGRIGVVHVGWRGLVAGVLESSATLLRSTAGGGRVRAFVGPCICAAHYAFGPTELDRVAEAVGGQVRSETASGEPALDLRVGVQSVLRRLDVELAGISPRCTAEDPGRLFSHRVRGDAGRQALVVWKEAL